MKLPESVYALLVKATASPVKLVLSLFLVATLVVVAGTNRGTLATFDASTSNPSNVLGNGTVILTDVAGTALSGSDCTTATNNGTCATLFTAASTGFKPGGSDVNNTATITYKGTITTSAFGVYAANYSTKGGSSSSLCTAAGPGTKVDFQVKQGATIIYPTSGVGYGTLDGFATTYTSSAALLHLKGGVSGAGSADVWATNDNSVFTINIHLDTTADNTYQGCQSLADFIWYASQ